MSQSVDYSIHCDLSAEDVESKLQEISVRQNELKDILQSTRHIDEELWQLARRKISLEMRRQQLRDEEHMRYRCDDSEARAGLGSEELENLRRENRRLAQEMDKLRGKLAALKDQSAIRQTTEPKRTEENIDSISSQLESLRRLNSNLRHQLAGAEALATETRLRQLSQLKNKTAEIERLRQKLTLEHQQRHQQQQRRLSKAHLQQPDHAERLQKLYPKLLKTIDAQSISAAMFADNALTLDELEKVQSKRRQPYKAAQSLLKIVLKQSSDVHGCFLNALYKSGDEGKALYKLILEDHCKSWASMYEHTQLIQRHYVYLVETLDVRRGLLDHLLSANVVKQAEWESVNAESTPTTQTEMLLSVLCRRTSEQFDKFLEALDTTGQQHVRNHITGRRQEGGTSTAQGDRKRELTVVQELEESNSKIASVLSQLEQMRPVHQLDTETATDADRGLRRFNSCSHVQFDSSGTSTPTEIHVVPDFTQSAGNSRPTRDGLPLNSSCCVYVMNPAPATAVIGGVKPPYFRNFSTTHSQTLELNQSVCYNEFVPVNMSQAHQRDLSTSVPNFFHSSGWYAPSRT